MLIALVVLLLGLLTTLVIGGASLQGVASDLRYQCDSAVGPDPFASQAVATPPARSARDPEGSVAAPTTNPYTEMTVGNDSSSWERACAAALREAPYQEAPVRGVAAGVAATCARQLALTTVSPLPDTTDSVQPGESNAPRRPAAGPVDLVRYVIYHAAASVGSGQCDVTGSGDVGVAAEWPDGRCTTTATVALLPKTLARQAACGQRVNPDTISAGDVVFWDFRDHAPTRAGIAIGPSDLVTTGGEGGRMVVRPIPSGADVRVKRVLVAADGP